MTLKRLSSLDELAFKGRNKAYGAFDLRRKYFRYLTFSLISGIILVSLLVLIPFLIYYFQPVPLIDINRMYDVEYYSLMPPPEEDLNKLALSLAQPLPETPQVPVVTDSIKPEDEKPPAEPSPPKNPDEQKEKSDSIGNAKDGSPYGQPGGSETGVSSVIDVYPHFPGGDEARLYFLRKNVRYPEGAIKGGIQGVVMVVFIIEADGFISNVEVSKGIGGGCDEEAIRVTRNMPRWEPGRRNGKSVRVMVRMPIVFRIPGRITS